MSNYDIVESLEDNIKVIINLINLYIVLRQEIQESKFKVKFYNLYINENPIWITCVENNLEMFKILTNTFKEKLPIDKAAIYFACSQNNLEMVKVLTDVFGKDLPIDSDAISEACSHDNLEIVNVLIGVFGKDLPIDNDAIYWACYNNNLEIVKVLTKTFSNKIPIKTYLNKKCFEIIKEERIFYKNPLLLACENGN